MNCFDTSNLPRNFPYECPYAPSFTTGLAELNIQVEGHMLLANGLRAELNRPDVSKTMQKALATRIASIDSSVEAILALSGTDMTSLDPRANEKPDCIGMPVVVEDPDSLNYGVLRAIHCSRDLAEQHFANEVS